MASMSKQETDIGKQVNVEALIDLCDKISIKDEESWGLEVDYGEDEQTDDKQIWRMVGRFLTDRAINS